MPVIGRRSAGLFDKDWVASAAGLAGSVEPRLAIAFSRRLRSPWGASRLAETSGYGN